MAAATSWVGRAMKVVTATGMDYSPRKIDPSIDLIVIV
jgi:hypothetical protein